MADLYIPKLAGYYLDISTIKDSYPSALSVKEFPFSNRNVVQNLGMKTRRSHVECSFQANPAITTGWNVGEAQYPTYENHFAFLEVIQNSLDFLTFTHPKYGEITGCVENLTTAHDDTQQFASVAFDFVQSLTTDVITYTRFIVPETSQSWSGVNETTTAKLEASQKAAINPTEWAGAASRFINTLSAYKSNITSPANSLIYTIDYADDLPGQIMSEINGAIDRIIQSFESIRNFPANFINNCITGVRELKALFTGNEAQYVHIMGASRVAYEAATVYQTDDENRIEVEKKEETITFDVNGNYLGTPTFEEVMTINELEDTVYNIKSLIDEVIIFDRDNRDLQNAARILQNYVNDVKLTRQKIVELTNVPLQSLHTLITKNGLSYQAAERILKLNPLMQNPNFVYGTVKILV